MKQYINLKIIMISFLLLSCSAYKTSISSNPMINEIILDYNKTNKLYIKNYSVFHIEEKKMRNEKLKVFTVIPENDKIAFKVELKDSLNKDLPTHYLEYKNKLFLWREGDQKTSDTVMHYLYMKNLVDSTYVKFQMGIILEEDIQEIVVTTDEELHGVTYVFCESNLKKIKKRIKSRKNIYPNDQRINIECN